MNSLSIFIYAADIINALNGVILFLVIVSTALAIITMVLYPIAKNDADGYSEGTIKKQADGIAAFFGKMLKSSLIVSATSMFFLVVVPTQTTMYLIAGSEISEEVATSERGKEVLNRVYDIIDRKLIELTKESTQK